ncbi:MAG: DUF1772 domain-containing protein [Bacteroidota bacterium]
MELSIKSFVLLGAVILTGLSAGLFYAWSVSVIPGTQNLEHSNYLQTMQSINRAILNPRFFAVFFGSIIFLSIGSIYEFNLNKTAFWLILAASIFYMVGTIGVTGLGNVPLNEQLDALKLEELSSSKLAEFREYYEYHWNRWHLVRTICTVISFILAVLSLFTQIKNV